MDYGWKEQEDLAHIHDEERADAQPGVKRGGG